MAQLRNFQLELTTRRLNSPKKKKKSRSHRLLLTMLHQLISLLHHQNHQRTSQRIRVLQRMSSLKTENQEFILIAFHQRMVQPPVTPKLLLEVDHLLNSSKNIQNQNASLATLSLAEHTYHAHLDSQKSTRRKVLTKVVRPFVSSARTVHHLRDRKPRM